MTLEIILGILAIVGTIAGTGLGYALSMRGKREEWAKEYREKRLAPLLDFIKEYMTVEGQRAMAVDTKQECNRLLMETIDKEQRREIEKVLTEAQEEEENAQVKLVELRRNKVWSGYSAGGYIYLDKKLAKLMKEWVSSFTVSSTQPTHKAYKKSGEIAAQIYNRVQEIIVRG